MLFGQYYEAKVLSSKSLIGDKINLFGVKVNLFLNGLKNFKL